MTDATVTTNPNSQRKKKNTSNEKASIIHPKIEEDSISNSEYRDLRRKYLVLEEQSLCVGRELRDVQSEVKALEEEKFVLLDELVVLEGLWNPSQSSHSLTKSVNSLKR